MVKFSLACGRSSDRLSSRRRRRSQEGGEASQVGLHVSRSALVVLAPMPKNVTRIAPVDLAGIKRLGGSRRGTSGRRRSDRSRRLRGGLHGGSGSASRGELEGVPADIAASGGSRLSSLGSLSSASLRLGGAGGTNRLHLGGGEARNVFIYMQGIAHGSAAVPGSSIGLAE